MAEQTRGHISYDGSHHNHQHADHERLSRDMRNPLLGANSRPQSSFDTRRGSLASAFGDDDDVDEQLEGRPRRRIQRHGGSIADQLSTMHARQNEHHAYHPAIVHGEGGPVPAMSPAEQLAMFNLVRSQQYCLNQMQIQNAQLAQQNNSGAGYYGGSTWNNLANNPQQASTMPYDNTPMPSHTFDYADRTHYDRPDLLHHYYGSGHGPQQHPSLLFEGPPSIEGMGGFGYHDRPSDQSFTGVLPSYTSPFQGFVQPGPNAHPTPRPTPARLPPISNFAPAHRRLLDLGGVDQSQTSSMQYTHAHPLPAAERLDVKSASHRIDSAHPTPTVPRENLPRYTAPAPTLSNNISISNGETQRGYVNPASLGAHKHIPAIKDYDLAHQVRERFDSLSPAIERFNDVVTRFNSNLLDAHQFFGALYELFYWSDSLNLLEILKNHIPNHFRIRDVNNFYEQLRAMAEDRAKRHEDVAAMRDALRSWARKTATEQERSGESSNTEYKEQQEAPTSVKARRQSKRASKGKATASLIVKLPIGASAVPSQPRLDNTVNVTEKPRNPKRRPRNGFKASDPPSETVEADDKDDIEECGEVKAERPNLIIKECPGTAGVTLINKKTEKSLPACQTPASWVDHIGPVYKTRWQILARDSEPYIHEPCKQGFEHPSLVRQHHPVKDPAKGETGEWCTEMLAKMENGDWQEWDHHESCKVTEGNINYTMVKDGYVIADQESVDKIEGAVNKGMDFKFQTSLWEEAQKKQAVASTSAAANSVEPVQSTETTATASSSAPGSSMKKSAVDGTTVAKAVVSAAAAKTPVKKVPAKRANPSSSKHGSTPQKRRYVVAGASDDDREAEARAVEILANGVKCRK